MNELYINQLQNNIKALDKDNKFLQIENKLLKEELQITANKCKQAIEILKLCNSKCSKEVIEILTGDKKE